MQSIGDGTPSSSTLIDIIDLTKESPTVKPRLKHRHTASECASKDHNVPERSDSRYLCRRHRLSNNQRHDTNESIRQETTQSDVTCIDKVVILDDTIYIDEDDIHYATESDNGEAIPLTCPICFEPLSSKLKPTTTRCGHIFCAECLVAFLRTSKKCPTCKANVTLRSCTRLFL